MSGDAPATAELGPDKTTEDLLEALANTVKMMDRGMFGIDIKVVRKMLVLLATWIALQSTAAGAQQLMCTNWSTDAIGQPVCLSSVPVQPPPPPPVIVQDPLSSFFGGIVGGILFNPGYGYGYGGGWHRGGPRGGWHGNDHSWHNPHLQEGNRR